MQLRPRRLAPPRKLPSHNACPNTHVMVDGPNRQPPTRRPRDRRAAAAVCSKGAAAVVKMRGHALWVSAGGGDSRKYFCLAIEDGPSIVGRLLIFDVVVVRTSSQTSITVFLRGVLTTHYERRCQHARVLPSRPSLASSCFFRDTWRRTKATS